VFSFLSYQLYRKHESNFLQKYDLMC